MNFKILNNEYEEVNNVNLNDSEVVEYLKISNNGLLIDKDKISFMIDFLDNNHVISTENCLNELMNNTGILYYDNYEGTIILEI